MMWVWAFVVWAVGACLTTESVMRIGAHKTHTEQGCACIVFWPLVFGAMALVGLWKLARGKE